MKTLVEKWIQSEDYSFNIKQYPIERGVGEPQEVVMRMHDEYEISIHMDCSGKRFIGNTIRNFSNDDLFMIGPHLPHSIQLDEGQRGHVITIHFLEDGFGKGFFQLPENKDILRLLNDAKLGLSFSHSTNLFRKEIRALFNLNNFDRMLAFFRLLKKMSHATHREILSSRGFVAEMNPRDYKMVNKTYEYIINHFEDNTINLDEISGHINMSPATFCRYFKKHFQKTFTKFLNEIRVGHACKMLQETDKNIAEIAFASGYNQLTNFNRQFKKIMGYSPKQYRKELSHNGVLKKETIIQVE